MANNDIIVSEMTSATQINTGDLMIMTQPDAQAETGYSTKKGTVLQVANKMLKGTEYTTDLPSFTDKNVLGGMEELKGDITSLLPVDEASGAIANFETALALPLVSLLADVVATGGNGTPDNPIPINGYSSANITRCGVNLYDNDFSHYRKPVNYYIKNVSLETGKVYTLKATLKSGGTAVSGCYFGVASKGEQYSEFLPDLYPCVKTDGTTSTSTLNVTSAWTSPKLCCYVTDEAQFNSIFENYDISLTEGTADFTPYNGSTVTIAFGQTVYGGVLDVTRGKLTVTWRNLTFADLSTKPWNVTSAGVFYYYPIATAMPDILLPLQHDPLCSSFVYQRSGTLENNTFRITDALYVKTDEAATVADFKTWLANNTGSFVYELATPVDIDLTPEVISAIVGENNVFADCGDITVRFKDSIQHYIDKKIAQTQALIL